MKRPRQAAKHNRRAVEAEARIDRVLLHARRAFMQKGYSRTSLDGILAKSGGSKATLLKYFGNKAGLFAAVVSEVAAQFVAGLQGPSLEGRPAQSLQAFGEAVLRFYLRPDSLTAYRGVVAEGHLNPGMAEAFYLSGHARIVKLLSDRLADWHAQGLIEATEPDEVAQRFLHALRGGLYERVLLGVSAGATEREIASQVKETVQIFLHGIGVSPLR